MTNFKKFEGLQDWMEQAECAGMDPELFFPGQGDMNTLRAAKEVCSMCVVREECLEYAVTHNIHQGIWGGESERERRRIRSRRYNEGRTIT